jgi:hypothetical protein
LEASPLPAAGVGAIATEHGLGAMAGDSPRHATGAFTDKPLAQLHCGRHCRPETARWCTTGTTKRASATGCTSRRRGAWTTSSHTGRCEASHLGMCIVLTARLHVRVAVHFAPSEALTRPRILWHLSRNDTDKNAQANARFKRSSRYALSSSARRPNASSVLVLTAS